MRSDHDLAVEQARLQQEAAPVRADLALDERFSEVGTVTLVGGAALEHRNDPSGHSQSRKELSIRFQSGAFLRR